MNRRWGMLAVACLWLAGCGQTPPSVLLVTIDAFRGDRLGGQEGGGARMPNLEALAAVASVFERAYTPVPSTLASHASILTGAWPARHGIRDPAADALESGVTTLAERLRDEGYATGAFVAAPALDRRHGLARGFAVYDDELGAPGSRRAESVTRRALAWLEALPPGPYLLWVQYFDAQRPSGDVAGAVPEVARYDGELSYIDEWIGRLAAALREAGRWDDTLVIVVGDHGEGFGEHGQLRDPAAELYEETTHVPLLIRRPDGIGAWRRVQALVRTIDVVPTVLDYLDLPGWEGIQGVSLLPLTEGRREPEPREVLLEAWRSQDPAGASLLGLRTDRFKLILTLDGDERVVQRELYDLEADPGERHTLASERPELVAELSQRLLAAHDAAAQ